jgi:hypothetical protein
MVPEKEPGATSDLNEFLFLRMKRLLDSRKRTDERKLYTSAPLFCQNSHISLSPGYPWPGPDQNSRYFVEIKQKYRITGENLLFSRGISRRKRKK